MSTNDIRHWRVEIFAASGCSLGSVHVEGAGLTMEQAIARISRWHPHHAGITYTAHETGVTP